MDQVLFPMLFLIFLMFSSLVAQTEEQILQEAIQVVRDFVGDPFLTPLFISEDNKVSFLKVLTEYLSLSGFLATNTSR